MHFYATKGDLVPVLALIEAGLDLQYARCGNYPTREFPIFASALDIPTLGIAAKESAVACDSFLVLPQNVPINAREIQRFSGEVVYAVDQLLNPSSVTLAPGGIYGSQVLLYGRVATVSASKEAKALLGRFERPMRKAFKKQAAFYVGPEAYVLKAKGVRLTQAVQSPRTYDLA